VTRPPWVGELVEGTRTARARELSRFAPPPGHQRRSAVLMLFAGAPDGAGPDGGAVEVLLTERASTLRSHAGQVAFPGGRLDPEDAGPGAAALREAQEETGLRPEGVELLAELPDLYLPVSDYAVTPVLGWWHTPSPVGVMDVGEVAQVVRVPVAELVDPANRFLARHPSGFSGPAFRAQGLFVWGFTAGLLDRVLFLCGWERPWDRTRQEDVPLLPDPPRARPRVPRAPQDPSRDRSARA
jgi:8-oxo-dGTP pyrophosphatase MutT (NUDIX family)